MSKVKEKTNGSAAVQVYPLEQVERWYYQMMLMRRFEEKAGQLYQMQQKIRGFCHLYIGQEAVGAGIESAIRPEDYVITAYRDHGNALMRSMSPRSAIGLTCDHLTLKRHVRLQSTHGPVSYTHLTLPTSDLV